MDAVFFKRPPFRTTAVPTDAVSLLIGVISGDEARRDRLRSSFALRRCAFRTVYVVGRACNDTRADVLRVGVDEGVGVVAASSGTASGTMTALRKTIALLHFAAHQPEEWLARIDDDSLIGPCLLLQYAARLPASQPVIAGVFEYFNLVLQSLRSTGHAYGVGQSRTSYGRRFHNCTERYDFPRCIGPFAFAKGPLMLLSRPMVRGVVASVPFADTLRAIPSVRIRHRVHDDVILGMWSSQVANATYVRFNRPHVWLDQRTKELQPANLLCAHKAADACFHLPLPDHERAFDESFVCLPRPPCDRCAHAASQQTCRLHLRSLQNRTIRWCRP